MSGKEQLYASAKHETAIFLGTEGVALPNTHISGDPHAISEVRKANMWDSKLLGAWLNSNLGGCGAIYTIKECMNHGSKRSVHSCHELQIRFCGWRG